MSTQPGPLRVLVADDEHVIADSLALILRGRGFDCRAAYSGEQAGALALEWKPDALITDVVMGEKDGVALAMQLAEVLPSCRVLLISGNTMAGELLAGSQRQGHDFPILAKPVHPNEILEFLAQPGRSAGGD